MVREPSRKNLMNSRRMDGEVYNIAVWMVEKRLSE